METIFVESAVTVNAYSKGKVLLKKCDPVPLSCGYVKTFSSWLPGARCEIVGIVKLFLGVWVTDIGKQKAGMTRTIHATNKSSTTRLLQAYTNAA